MHFTPRIRWPWRGHRQAQVVNALIPSVTVGVATFLLNVPLFLAGWKMIGFHLLASSLFSMVVSSLAMDAIALFVDIPGY